MRKIAYYLAMMLLVLVLLPLIIVRGCSLNSPDESGVRFAEDSQNDQNAGQKSDGKTNQTADRKIISRIGLKTEINIKVLIKESGKIEEMNIEDYVIGVVAAEMPAAFDSEALKAQAVAARTYAFARMEKNYNANYEVHKGADICTDPGHCQAWISKENARRKWGIFWMYRYWNKIKNAVEDTRGIIICYDGEIVNPVFHANSGGHTENAEDVWEGGSVPYLKGVISNGEENSKQYSCTISITPGNIKKILAERYPGINISVKDPLSDIKIMGYTGGGRVKEIAIAGIVMKGTEFRKLFSLKSANFSIKRGENGSLKITTIGYGHGVGMSQCGANYLAKNGGTYEEILSYYYSGITLGSIYNYLNNY